MAMLHGTNKSLPLEPGITKPAPVSQSQSRQSHLIPGSPIPPPHSNGTTQSTIGFQNSSPSNISPDGLPLGPSLGLWSSLLAFTTRRHVPILVLSVLCSIIIGSIPAIQSYLFGKILARFAKFGAGVVTGAQFKEELARCDIYLILLGTFCWSFAGSMFAGWTWFGALQARSASEKLFGRLINQPITWFDQRQDGMGALTTKTQGFVKDLAMSTGQPFGMAIRDAVSSLICFGLAFYASWKLTLMMLSPIPIVAILMLLFSSRTHPNIEGEARHMSAAAKHVTTAFSIIDTVKCYSGHLQERLRYSHSLNQAAAYYFRRVSWLALQSSVLRFITLGIFVQGLWYGSTLIGHDMESAGTIFTAFWCCVIAISSLMQMMPHMVQFEAGKVAACQLLAIVAAPSEPQAHSLMQSPSYAHDIVFRNVWFSYPTQSDQMVLYGVNLFFAAGDFTFVVGKSGCGKSTLGQLITKFYGPSEGTISFGDCALQSIPSSWIREHIMLVEQQSVLFNTTVKENIALGKDNPDSVTMQEIEEAAEFASIRDAVLGMPEGFETLVGRKGVTLSGGQLQRVALARARLRDPPILILDESTSALDHINRLAVMDAIRQWRKGKTTIVITHDISQVHSDDFVYVMKEGQVVEEGFRKSLAKLKGSFFQELAKSRNSPGHIDRFTGTTVANLSEYDHRDDEYLRVGDHLNPERLNSMVFSDGDQSIARQSGRWLSAFGSSAFGCPIIGGWVSQYGPNAIRQSSTLRHSLIEMTPSSFPQSPSPDCSRIDRIETTASHTPQFRPVRWSSLGGQPRPRFSMLAPGSKLKTYELQQNISSERPISKAVSQAIVSPGPELEELELGDVVTNTKSELDRPLGYSMKSILTTVWPNIIYSDRFLLLLGFAAALAFAASTPVFAFIMSKLLHTFYSPIDRKAQALRYSLIILGIAVGGSLTLFVGLSLVQRVGQSWVNKLRSIAVERVLSQPREFFDREGNEISQMTACLDHHAEEMQHILGRFAGNMMVVITMVTVAIVWSMISCWKLTLVMIACTPIILLITNALSTVAGKLEAQIANDEEQMVSIFAEVFSNIKTVRILNLENWFQTKHQTAVETLLKTVFKKGIYVGTFFGLSQAALLFVTALIFHYGGVLLRSHQSNLNDIIQVFTLLLFSISTATMTLASIPQLSACRESASRLLRLVNLPQDSHEGDGKTKIQSADEIIFHNVNFRYPSRPDQPILHNLNLTIAPGTSTALVGPSGSGKSTIASLLLKLYTPLPSPNSTLKISSHAIHTIHTPTLRTLITLVSQTPTLFPTSISANIVYGLRTGNPLNSAENVRAAAIAAGIHDFISSLPSGYDTVIGEGGMGLSGGQAQRVAIARALARKPNVLILDEATSALDEESAAAVREAIFEMRRRQGGRGMTLIVVTHEREWMRLVERVVMVDGGRVVEEGGYGELLRRGGRFAGLMRGERWGREGRRRSLLAMERVVGVV